MTVSHLMAAGGSEHVSPLLQQSGLRQRWLGRVTVVLVLTVLALVVVAGLEWNPMRDRVAPPGGSALMTARNAAPLPVPGPTVSPATWAPQPIGASSHASHPAPVVGRASPRETPSSPSPAYLAWHYWVGAVYNGPPGSAASVETQLQVPHSSTETDDYYVVLLSAFDNSGTYDQIGIVGANGHWAVSIEQLSACGSHDIYDGPSPGLERGVTYTFGMSIASGTLTFYVYKGSTTVLSTPVSTTATAFVLDQIDCDNYTLYEEVFKTSTQNEPSWDFFFTSNKAGGTAVTAWKEIRANAPGTPPVPSEIHTLISGSSVTVENQWFQMVPGWDDISIPDSSTSVSGTLYMLRVDPAGSGTISLSVSSAPSGWTVTCNPAAGQPIYSSSISASFSSTAGDYHIAIKGTDSNGHYSLAEFWVHLISVSLGGRVTDVSTGIGVPTASIHLSGPATYDTTTDSNGYYTIYRIKLGTYTETVTPPCKYTIQSASVSIFLGPNRKDFALAKTTGTLYGYVYEAGTGGPLEGAVVTDTCSGHSTTSDSSGYYQFTVTAGNNVKFTAAATLHKSDYAYRNVPPGGSAQQLFYLALKSPPPCKYPPCQAGVAPSPPSTATSAGLTSEVALHVGVDGQPADPPNHSDGRMVVAWSPPRLEEASAERS